MMSMAFCRTMLGIPSGPLALYGDSALTWHQICSLEISAGAGRGTGYWKFSSIVDSNGFGEKNISWSISVFSLFVACSYTVPSSFFILRVGI